MSNPEPILFEIVDYFSDPNYEPLQLGRIYFELNYIVMVVYTLNENTEYLIPINFHVPNSNGELNNPH